jgi:hypothetical protein
VTSWRTLFVDAAQKALAMAEGESEWLDPDEENGDDEEA